MNTRRDEPATKKDLDQVKQELTDKIDANTVTLDRIAAQVIENREQLSKMLTREEYKKDYNELLRGQDKMMTILTRMDQERAATNARIDRVETDVEKLKAKLGA